MIWLCTQCGYQGNRKRKVSGSFILEMLLWITGLFMLIFVSWPAILLPIFYSSWRLCSSKKICPKCQNQGMIPSNSPIAQKMLSQLNKPHEEPINH